MWRVATSKVQYPVGGVRYLTPRPAQWKCGGESIPAAPAYCRTIDHWDPVLNRLPRGTFQEAASRHHQTEATIQEANGRRAPRVAYSKLPASPMRLTAPKIKSTDLLGNSSFCLFAHRPRAQHCTPPRSGGGGGGGRGAGRRSRGWQGATALLKQKRETETRPTAGCFTYQRW